MLKDTLVVFFGLFIKSMLAGLIAVLTPVIYAILPVTIGYLSPRSKPKSVGRRNTLLYAFALITIFTAFGILVSVIIRLTGVRRFTTHWLFYFAVCRLFAGLGIAFLGAFDLKLPSRLTNPAASKAGAGSIRGIFYMALTLPVFSFSSIAPMVVFVLLMTINVGSFVPVIGLSGFSIGLAMPFVFPGMLHALGQSKVLLNQVKVLLGFVCILVALKFFSLADVAYPWHILDRETFIAVVMLFTFMIGLYMLGIVKMPKDYAPIQNDNGVEYISIPRLFIAIAAFSFVLYLLPGMWGAPLRALSNFLPQ